MGHALRSDGARPIRPIGEKAPSNKAQKDFFAPFGPSLSE
jgi:hypothetical protein